MEPTAPALSGRERERALLADHLDASLNGHGRLVLIGGEAGIGKTALAADVAARAEGAALVVWGRCYDLSATPPYGPWREIVEASSVRGRFPDLATALAGGAPLGANSGHDELTLRVRGSLTDLASERPILVILDDLQWSDPASLETLRTVARSLHATPILVIGTYRADELTRRHPLYQLVPVLVREAGAARIDLRRLDAAAVTALTSSRVMPPGDRRRLVDYLQAHAEGNPFFLMELLRSLEEDEILRPGRDGWVVGDLGRLSVPPLLRQVIDGRLDRHGEATRERLEIAAVTGQEVPIATWAAVAGFREEDAPAIVEPVVDAHLLEATSDGEQIRFAHALIREALYDGISPLRRRVLHRQVADTLITHPASDPDPIAYHLHQARDDRARDWLVRAGDRAQRAYAWSTAVERFETAITLYEGTQESAAELGWLLCRTGRLLRFAETRRGLAYLAEAGRFAEATGDRLLAAFALADSGWLRALDGQYERGISDLDAGIRAIEEVGAAGGVDDASFLVNVTDSPPQLAMTGGTLSPLEALANACLTRRSLHALFLAGTGRYAEALAVADSCLASAAQAGTRPRPGDTDAHFARALVLGANGSIEAARRAFAAARESARAADHYIMIGYATYRELRDLVMPFLTPEITLRRHLAAEVDEPMRRAVGAFSGSTARRLSLCLMLAEGTWSEVLAEAQHSRTDGTAVYRGEAILTLAVVAHHQGAPELARSYIGDLLPEGPGTAPAGISCTFLDAQEAQRVAFEIELAAGHLDLAREWLGAQDRWLTWCDSRRGRAETRLAWARFHAAAGQRPSAREAAVATIELASAPAQPIVLASAHRLLGEIETAAGRHDAARSHLATSLAITQECELPYERALTQLAIAECEAVTGATTEARTAIAAVRRVCEPLGAAPVLERAARRETRLGPKGSSPTYPGGLSTREIEVLRLVAQGMTDAEAGSALSISPRTVGQHLRSIYTKLDVSSRAAATRLAVEQGIH